MDYDNLYTPRSNSKYLKVPLIGLNVILWLLGLVLVIIGGVGVTFFSKFKEFADAAYAIDATEATKTIKNLSVSIPAGTLTIGLFFLILTLIGIWCTNKETMVGLVFYIVLMLVLLVVLIGIGGESLTYHNDDAKNEIGQIWFDVSNSTRNKTITNLETYLECCQFNSSDPHIDLCPKVNSTSEERLYVGTDCSHFYEEIQSKLYLIGSAGVTIGVLALFSMFFAVFLIARLYRINKQFK